MSKTTSKQSSPSSPKVHFVAAGLISSAVQQIMRNRLGKSYTEAAWRAVGVLEGTVDGRRAIAFPMPSRGFKVCLYEQPDAKSGKPYSFIFADGGKADLLLVGEAPEVLLTAGEWDMLAALSAGFPCVATGTGGEGTWKTEWSQRLAGKRVFIIYDVDEAGVRGSAKAANALRGIATGVVTVRLPLSGDPKLLTAEVAS